MKLLYFDCVSGAAGDMLLGAFLDAGVPEETVRRSLDTLGLPGWQLDVERTTSDGLSGTRVTVRAQDSATSRDHSDIRQLLQSASLAEGVRVRALRTFALLAEAEAKVHGCAVDDVHFHEVGGTDAIVDIVGCATAFEYLAPERVHCSRLVTGRGWTGSAHGLLPVPAPAVLEILRGVPLEERGEDELVTPTGAAILVAASDGFGGMPPMSVDATGYGFGHSVLDRPNLVRILVGQAVEEPSPAGAWVIETNIDDMSAELIPHTIDALLRAGASDAWSTPIVMKKGRPAVTLSVLTTEENREMVLDTLYRETTTLGVRSHAVSKDELERRWVEVEVGGHPLKVKLGLRGGEVVSMSPEYEDALAVARVTGLPLKEVFARATGEARRVVSRP